MVFPITTVLLGLLAVSSGLLGSVVLVRNPRGRAHRAFAALSLNIALWTIGVAVVTQCHTLRTADLFLRITFSVACFLPATFFYFIGVFPSHRFQGPRWLLTLFLVSAPVLAAASFLPGNAYLVAVRTFADKPPEAEYGPLFYGFATCIALGMFFAYPNLFRKWRNATGVARRQLEHVLLGVTVSTFLASATNVLAPVLNINFLQSYGPVSMFVMVASFSYAMVRYHLLDMRVLLSRATLYTVLTSVVLLVFWGAVSVVHWSFNSSDRIPKALPTLLAALVIALVLQPIKEHVQLLLNRTILKRHYDVQKLLTRASRNAARIVQLDRLLETICGDIAQTMGASSARVLLVSEKDRSVLVSEYSTTPEEKGAQTRQHAELVNYLADQFEPLSLEQLVHAWPHRERAHVAAHLAELGAYVCVPLKVSSGLLGIMTLGQKTSRDMYTSHDLGVLTALAGPMATAIENARLYQKLEEANLHLDRILSNMRGALIAVDASGALTTVNRGAVDMLGDLTVGGHLTQLPPQIAQVLKRTLERRDGISDFETTITRSDDIDIPVVMSSASLTSHDNHPLGAMVMVYDLTQVKRLEQNVQRADRLSSIGTLAAGMAHEIKNPLVSIKTFTQLLLKRYDEPDFRATFAEIVPHEVERIDSIVTSLLEFARPKPTQLALRNLRGILDEVLALVGNQLHKANIALETVFVDENIQVYGDEQRLHQVFLNLILNAIDAMNTRRAGVLRVETWYEHMRLRDNMLTPWEETECVRIAISDTGCGIPKENLDRIFTPFYTTKENGSGLGLAVVHEILAEHHGAIEVTSVVNEGATFIVTLPLAASMALVGNE